MAENLDSSFRCAPLGRTNMTSEGNRLGFSDVLSAVSFTERYPEAILCRRDRETTYRHPILMAVHLFRKRDESQIAIA